MSVRFPQVDFYIGDRSLMVPANYLVSFTYEDTIAMNGDSWSLELFDKTWEILETDFIPSMASSADKQVKFRFGWGPERMSQFRYGVVTEFTPSEVTRAGIRVNVSGFDTVSGKDLSQERVEATYQGKISDVVQQIADKNGWKVEVEETVETSELEGRDGGKQPKVWRKNQKTDLAFLNELAQRAKSVSGQGSYRVYLDSQDESLLHFHPDRAVSEPLHRTYVVQTDNMGEVINFSPTIEGKSVVAMGGSTASVVYRDPTTRKLTEKTVSPEDPQEGVALGTKAMTKGGTKVKHVLPPVTEVEADSRVGAYYEALSWAVNKATLEVVGDPSLLPGRIISVIVKTSKNQKFFTSGLYLVEKVTHSLGVGTYTSQLDLIKNANDLGNLPTGKGTQQSGQ